MNSKDKIPQKSKNEPQKSLQKIKDEPEQPRRLTTYMYTPTKSDSNMKK